MLHFLCLAFTFFCSVVSWTIEGTLATWNLNANGNWNVNANWSPGTFPNAVDDTANFFNVITATRTVSLGQNITVGTVSFDSNRNYVISGANTLTFKVNLGNAQLNLTNVNGNGVDTISCPVLLNNDLTMNHSSPSNFTLSGIISDGGGGFGITKAGSGTGALILNAANTYTGLTNINDGRLTYNVNGAIFAGNTVNVGDGSGAAGSAILGMVGAMTPVNAFNVLMNTDGSLIQNSGATIYLSGLQGSGSVNLTNATAATNLFYLNANSNATFSGTLSGGIASTSLDPAAGNRFIKAGTGTLTLTNASTQASRIFIAEGVIDITDSNALGASGANSGTFVQGGTTTTGSLYLENNISCPKRILLNGAGVSGTGALRNLNGNNTITGNVQIGWAGGAENASGATIQVDSGTVLTLGGILQGANNLTKTGTGTLLLNGTVANTLTGSININSGMVQLNKTAGINAIAGPVQINPAGVLRLLNTNQISNTSVVNLNGGTFELNGNTETIGRLVFTSGILDQTGAITLSLNSTLPTALSMSDNTTIVGPITFTNTGGVTYNGTTTRAILSGPLNLGVFAHNFDIGTSLDSISMDISGVISGTGSISKITSGGVLQFSGLAANTYTGATTISAGQLLLNKTAGVNAIAGNVAINGGGTLKLAAPDQIANTSVVTLSGGVFDLNGNQETIGSLVFNSGTFAQGGAQLSISSNSATALSMGNGAVINGPILFTTTGGITYTGAVTGAVINGNMNLGTFAHNFNIANGTDPVDMDIAGVISGSGSISKITGLGVLRYSGSVANTHTGATTISAGELLLNKTAGLNAINGNVTVNAGGTLSLGANEQILNSSVITLAGGTFNMAGFSETIGQLTFNSGTLNQGAGSLFLGSNTTALSLGNGAIVPGSVNLTGSGAVVYNGTTTTAVINGVLDLGASTHTFNISNGTATTDLQIANVISSSGGGITKTGAGRLEFSGSSANTYSGLTTLSAGEIFLNKVAGTVAIPGNVTINTTAILSLGASEQVADTALMTLAGGTFNMAGFDETIDQLTYTSGNLNQAGGLLTLSSNTTALSIGNGLNITGNLTLSGSGSVVYTGASATSTLSGLLDLGSSIHNFNVANGTAVNDLQITNAISGSGGGITKTGAGTLVFSGTSPNTYSGLTTVSAGNLILSKTPGVNAISGDVLLLGGTLTLGGSSQISDTSAVTLSGGTFNLSGFNETIGQLTFNSGILNQGGAILSLSNNTTALSLGNGVTISGNINLTGSGDVVYTGTTATSTISGLLDLGANTHIFNIANGTATTDLQITNVVSGLGGVTKSGAGRLTFSGTSANTYTGLTTVSSGELFLNKTAGTIALAGDVSITGGTLVLGASEQIGNSSVVTQSGGTFNIGAFNETISSYVFNGGVYNSAGSNLFLASNSVALSLGDGVNLTGSAHLTGTGNVEYTGTTATSIISALLDLGGNSHVFDIADGAATPDLQITNQISGLGGGIIKNGPGRLEFLGTLPNAYTGLTTVSSGELFLNKTAAVIAVPGDLSITGGTLVLGATEQIADSSIVNQSNGTLNLAGFDETIGTYIFNGGVYNSGGATLNLANAGTALSMRDTTLPGNLKIINGGSVLFDSTNNGTALVSGNIDLNGSLISFDIADGTAVSDMVVSGVISNGGLVKDGLGVLNLVGANTYSGGTLINSGILLGDTVSLQGNIIDNATLIFDQSLNGTYSGVLSGSGTMIKQGAGNLIYTNTASFSGLTKVSEGGFVVNGTYGGGGTLITDPGTTLSGVGTIGQNSTIYGILSPGNGFGTLQFVGDQVLATGSVVAIQLNPNTNDLINITGGLVIQPGAILNVQPDPGSYTIPQTHLIIKTTTGINGTFSSVTSSLPLFYPNLVYTPTTVYLQGLFVPFSLAFPCGNAGAVSDCLDGISPSAESDLGQVIHQLRIMTNLEEIKNGLLQLQPSAFTSLAINQENNFIYVRNSIYHRIDDLNRCSSIEKKCGFGTWIEPLLGAARQKKRKDEPGFKSRAIGFAGGIDYHLSPVLVGCNFAYTRSNLFWHENRGKASSHSIYTGIYGGWRQGGYRVEGMIEGNYSPYQIKRRINFGQVDRKAKSYPYEASVASSFKGAFDCQFGNMFISPFVRTDYMFSRRAQLKEHGAQSLDLIVKSNSFELFTGEWGFELWKSKPNEFEICSDLICDIWKPFLRLSLVYENRLRGKNEKALFYCSCPMKVRGLYPSRTLGTLTLGFDVSNRLCKFFSIYYDCKYGKNFSDNSLYINMDF